MKILITGASGLLGSSLVKVCLEREIKLVCGARNISNRCYLNTIKETNNIEIISLDMCDSSTFPKTPVDVVINGAALASPFEKDQELMNEINIEGVKKLYSWAVKIGAKQFVQISSIACFGSDSFDNTITEDNCDCTRDTIYGKTKKSADLWLKSQTGLPVLTIHPCYMLGSFDSRPSSGAIFFAIRMKKFSSFINNYKNFVSVSDVAKGTVDAIIKKAVGSYILGGHNYKIRDFIKIVSNTVNEDLSFIKEINMDELEGVENSTLIKEFCLSYQVDSYKAGKELGYSPKVSLEDMVEETIAYFESKKMLRFKGRRK